MKKNKLVAVALAVVVVAVMVTYKVLWDRHEKNKKGPKPEEEHDESHRWN